MSANTDLVLQARSSDPDARQKAAYLVSHSTDAHDYPLMFELLGDKDWRVRKTIVDGFVRDPQPEVVAGLLDSLADAENAGKRNSATEALIRIGGDAIIPIVERLRIERDVDVRLSLVNLLGDLRSSDAFDETSGAELHERRLMPVEAGGLGAADGNMPDAGCSSPRNPLRIRSGVNGNSRKRTPVASKMALAIAAAIGRIDGSPAPVGGSSGWLM